MCDMLCSRRISKRFFVYAFLFAAAFTATMTDVVSLRALTCESRWLPSRLHVICSIASACRPGVEGAHQPPPWISWLGGSRCSGAFNMLEHVPWQTG